MGQAGRAHVVTAVGATPVIFRQISAMLYVALLALVTDPNARVKPLCTCARHLRVNHVPPSAHTHCMPSVAADAGRHEVELICWRI